MNLLSWPIAETTMEEIRLEGINIMVMGTVVAMDVVEVVVGVVWSLEG